MFLGHVPSVLGQRFGNVEVSDKQANVAVSGTAVGSEIANGTR